MVQSIGVTSTKLQSSMNLGGNAHLTGCLLIALILCGDGRTDARTHGRTDAHTQMDAWTDRMECMQS